VTGNKYGIKNVYRPSQLAPRAYGWSTAPPYTRADVPTALMERPANITSDQLAQQFAYEWFQSGESSMGLSNPPFVSGAAGRLLPGLNEGSGGPARILRGYIRRSQYEVGDAKSRARLYFMYNPEIISRDYVSYLDQGALDPFNTVYQSGNLVAPPSILDFSFDLFFDRQEEATQKSHPGVFVDYQFFDLVVRNVVPTDVNATSNTLPDNGVMMVNPRNITVVFSPQLTVEGRPLNARVTFEKFTHRMTPIRMRISLTMRAVYMGPIKDMTEYRAEVFQAEASIPTGEVFNPPYIWNMEGLQEAQEAWAADPTGAGSSTNTSTQNYGSQQSFANTNNGQARKNALDYAKAHIIEGTTRYASEGSGLGRNNLPTSAECSGLITGCYKAVGLADGMGWSDLPGTHVIISRLNSSNYKNAQKFSYDDIYAGKLQYGDIIIRPGHMRWFEEYTGGTGIRLTDAASASSSPQVGSRVQNSKLTTDYFAFRPMPLGADMSYNATNNPASSNAPRAV
jgi:hypothetical protein